MKTPSFIPAALLFALIASPAWAGTKIAPVPVGDAMGYKEAVVTMVEEDGLRVRHKDGLAKVPIERVPAHLKDLFGLNPEVAQAHRALRAAETEARRRVRAQVAEEEQTLGPVTFRLCEPVVRVLADGVLVDGFSYTDGEKEGIKRYETVRISGPTALSPRCPVVLGCRLTGIDWMLVEKFMPGPVFIETDPSGIADGDLLQTTVYRSGSRPVVMPEGGVLTLKRFVADRGQALTELADSNSGVDARR